MAAAIAAGLVLLVWAATAGPVGILSPSGRRFQFNPPPPTPTPSTSAGPAVDPLDAVRGRGADLELSWVGQLLMWALALAFLGLVVVGLRWLWRNRWRPSPKPQVAAFDVLPESAVAEALRNDVTAQLAAVEEGSPRNGIVRCWLRLEASVGDAGLPRNRWETSAEYTLRILKTLDVDPRAIGRLSQLYREARFSEHELGEAARAEAAAALRQLHADLQEAGNRDPHQRADR
jgi:Domain of unknown function (DUF4129)